MRYCCVPGCGSNNKNSKVTFYSIPSETKNGHMDPYKKQRRVEWLKVINGLNLSEKDVKNARICSKHFVSGRPAVIGSLYNVDWVPTVNVPVRIPMMCELSRSASVQNIITNLPEITEEFDVPEYITLDKYIFNERKIESDLIHKYITNPICDENGYYRNDHDYLGLPIIRTKTDQSEETAREDDHNYSTSARPACLYTDLRHYCNICQCNNRNLFTFNTHMMIHTMKNHVTCSICEQKFLTTTCLHNHMNSHTTICDVCGSEVPTVQIKAHQQANRMQLKHLLYDYKVSMKEKVHFCVFCMKEFAEKKEYFQHLSKHKVIRIKKGRKVRTVWKKVLLPDDKEKQS